MHPGASRWLVSAGILPALVLGCLGVETAGSHPVGWLLLAVSVTYLWVAVLGKPLVHRLLQARGSKCLCLALSGCLGVLLAAPVEHLAAAELLPAGDFLEPIGSVLAAGGAALGAWAHTARSKLERLGAQGSQLAAWAQTGPYQVMRYPGFAALLAVTLGLALSYASMAALALAACLILPALVMQIRRTEQRMLALFGDSYRSYVARTARLLPGIW